VATGQPASRHASHHLVDDLPVDRNAAFEIQPELEALSFIGSRITHLKR
jgi:hypothetical protein